MNFITSNLELVSLSLDGLDTFIGNLRSTVTRENRKIIKEANYSTLTKSINKAIRLQYTKIKKNPTSGVFHGVWIIIRKSDRIVVGSFSVIGPREGQYEVNLSYFLDRNYEGLGYIDEIIKEVYLFALVQTDILYLIRSNIYEVVDKNQSTYSEKELNEIDIILKR